MIINIQDIVNEKIKDMEERKIIEITIGETLEKTILKAVVDALEGYKIKRSIEEKISNEVSSVVNDIGFTAYNSFIAEKVKEITESVCMAEISGKIQDIFNKMLIAKRDIVKISEIFDKYREWVCETVENIEKYDLQNFHIKFEKNEKWGWFDIELAKKEPAGRYGIGDDVIKFTLHRKCDDKSKGFISGVYLDGLDVKKKIRMGHMTEIELLLVNIMYNETPIDIDVESQDDIDSSYDIDD